VGNLVPCIFFPGVLSLVRDFCICIKWCEDDRQCIVRSVGICSWKSIPHIACLLSWIPRFVVLHKNCFRGANIIDPSFWVCLEIQDYELRQSSHPRLSTEIEGKKERSTVANHRQHAFASYIYIATYIILQKLQKQGPIQQQVPFLLTLKNQDFFYNAQAREVTYNNPNNTVFPQDTTDTTNLDINCR